MTERIRVAVDEGLCAVSTTCVFIAPALFEVPSDAYAAQVRIAVVDDPELIVLAREACDACPTSAIQIEPADD